jgi:Ni2+-binding GTPase involved in maturation of urease and hydrogenase
MGALETLQAKFGCQLLFVESGGDNLAANYSRELADYIIYVIDVSVRKFFIRICFSSQPKLLVGR